MKSDRKSRPSTGARFSRRELGQVAAGIAVGPLSAPMQPAPTSKQMEIVAAWLLWTTNPPGTLNVSSLEKRTRALIKNSKPDIFIKEMKSGKYSNWLGETNKRWDTVLRATLASYYPDPPCPDEEELKCIATSQCGRVLRRR